MYFLCIRYFSKYIHILSSICIHPYAVSCIRVRPYAWLMQQPAVCTVCILIDHHTWLAQAMPTVILHGRPLHRGGWHNWAEPWDAQVRAQCVCECLRPRNCISISLHERRSWVLSYGAWLILCSEGRDWQQIETLCSPSVWSRWQPKFVFLQHTMLHEFRSRKTCVACILWMPLRWCPACKCNVFAQYNRLSKIKMSHIKGFRNPRTEARGGAALGMNHHT